MKKMLLKFSDSLLSKQQMKSVKGGTTYCNCPWGWVGVPSNNGDQNICQNMGCTGGDGGGY